MDITYRMDQQGVNNKNDKLEIPDPGPESGYQSAEFLSEQSRSNIYHSVKQGVNNKSDELKIPDQAPAGGESGYMSAEFLSEQSCSNIDHSVQREPILPTVEEITPLSIHNVYDALISTPAEEFLTQMSASDIEEMWKQLFERIDAEGNFRALLEACNGEDNLVIFAVAASKSHDQLNQRNDVGQGLLHIATASCDASTVRYIYTKGGDLKYRDAWGNNPLHIAADLGRADCIEQFCTKAERHEQQHARFGVRFIPINRKEDICLINNDGKAPIHLAVEGGHVDTLRMLLNKSKPARDAVDIRRYTDGYSPAHIAVEQGSLEMLELCLRNGSDSEVRNFRCETPQQMAYLLGNREMVQLCQSYGASPEQLKYADTELISDSDEEMFEEVQYGVQSMQIA